MPLKDYIFIFCVVFFLFAVILYLSLGLKGNAYVSLLGLLMAKGKKIYHRNDMRMALSALSLPPRRILWLVLAQLEKDDDGIQAFDADKKFTIKAKEYAQLCQIDESVAYKQLKDGIREIRSHLMEITETELLSKEEFEKERRDKHGMILFTVAKYGYYNDGDGYIEVRLDPIMAPFISKLRNNFTGQFLLSALRLPDSNANKLYLLLREWISSGMSIHKDIEVDELKSKLGVLDKKAYDRFNLFSSSFFSRAVEKIVNATEFKEIKMEIIERDVRRAKKVRISYKYEGQKKDFVDAGFFLGKDKKSKSEINKKSDNKKQSLTQEHDSEVLKQINGRFYDKKAAEAAGYDWDEY